MVEPRTELQRNAVVEARRKELDVYQRALDTQWMNNRMEDGRMGRSLALIQREAEMEKDFQERTDHAALVNARAERETKLGIEIAQVRREEVCQLLRRHYLRERDPSLKELAKKLQAAYVCRDIQQQILHNEYRRLQEKAEDIRSNNILLNALSDDQDALAQEEKEKMQRTSQYCKDLQQQLVNRQLQKQCQYEDTLIEKKMLEDIVRTMSDEDMKELKQKRYLMEKMRQEMKTFQQARDAWKQKQKEMVIIEERQIEEQNKMVADRSSAIIAERERKMKLKEAINERIAAKILEDEAARQDRTNMVKFLQEQEYLEKNHQNDLAEKAAAERRQREDKDAFALQVDERRRAERDRREREAEFRKETEAKMAADMAKEREERQKKKEKGKLYSQELLKQIQDNARRRQAEKEMDENRAIYVRNYDKKWCEEVQEERLKMIEEHVPQVLGYLQAGVIQSHEVPAVKSGIAKKPELANLNIDALTAPRRAKRFAKCNAQCRMLREF